MKKNIYEHIATPDQIPNTIKEPETQDLTYSLTEFSKQNKDLTARLSVQLRRNGELELQIKKLGEVIQSLKQQNEEISNNSLKNRELAKLNAEELFQKEEAFKKAEIELGQLSIEYRQLKEKHEQRSSEVEKRLKRFVKYRKKIQREIRPLVNRLYEQNYALLQQVAEAQKDRAITVEQKQNIENQMKRLEGKHHKKILAAADLQEEIISTYEFELKQIQNLLDQRDIELTQSEEKRRYLETYRDKYVVMENKAIAAERVRFETERKYDEKISELRTYILELKEKHKQEDDDYQKQESMLEKLRVENHELSTKYFEAASKSSSVRGENQANFVQWQKEKSKNKKLSEELIEQVAKIHQLEQENTSLRLKVEKLTPPPQIPSLIPEDLKQKEATEAKIEKNTDESYRFNDEKLNLPDFIEDDLDSESFVILSESEARTEPLEIKSPLAINEQTKAKKANADSNKLGFDEFEEIDKLIREIETGYPVRSKNLD
ncbi:MAG: hypothetical protein VX642_00330 [Bdellovibrionota bacterium]|nr:hypothetical protein [Bdellovibrionota bacterium]